ncbi:nitrobindin family protein [Streptomyces xanthii]|uniref:Peroxynitrite isomerase n=1 Tax=Streptomyces xanthii TaxID=2768069 RepID=A0A7H1BG67_9ACTN|nr:FABP family protein [Streptomyces xanthii]QNS07722.1 FABP family protein [Streptomyces xanthii]
MTDPAPSYPYADASPEPHPLLAPVLGLIGTWRGRGAGEYPTLESGFTYGQEVTFSHDGRPFLQVTARAWITDGEGGPVRPAARESGWWRLQPDGRIEALITQPTGIAEVAVGYAADGVVDLTAQHVALTPTAKHVEATRRRYTLTDSGALAFAHDLAAVGQPLQHHLSALLHRADAE